MFAWLEKLAPLRVRISSLAGRMTEIEDRQEMIEERFTRRQNRENMRLAREKVDSESSITQEAADILAAAKNNGAATGQVVSDKLALWQNANRGGGR